MATKRNDFDDDSYANLMFGLGAARQMGDKKTLDEVKRKFPKEYAEFEEAEAADILSQKKSKIDAEDKAFLESAYKNPKVKKAMDAEMKKLGITPEQFFGKK